jgi:magnesium chelatase family protein
LECLREPLESGHVKISRAGYQISFPAQFQLIAAMNPCPCGYAGSTKRECVCTPEQVMRYMNKLSGPLMDRIDLQVEVSSLSPEILSQQANNQNENLTLKEKILAARQRQLDRQGKCNKALGVQELEAHCFLEDSSRNLLNQAMQKFNLSARAYHRIVKVARTIADLSESNMILSEHMAEALTYRCLDKAGLIV